MPRAGRQPAASVAPSSAPWRRRVRPCTSPDSSSASSSAGFASASGRAGAPPAVRAHGQPPASARVAQQHERGLGGDEAPRRVGEVRQPPCAGAVARGGERSQHVELALALGVELGVLDGGRGQRRDRGDQREVVLGELVRRDGVQREHPDQPVRGRDQGVGEDGLEARVVELRHLQVAGVVQRVLADHGGCPVDGRPARQAAAELEREAIDPLLVALDPGADPEPLAGLVEQVDERAVAARDGRRDGHRLLQHRRQVERRRDALDEAEHGLRVAPALGQQHPQRPGGGTGGGCVARVHAAQYPRPVRAPRP